MKKNILSMLLAVIMVMGCVAPVSVQAAEVYSIVVNGVQITSTNAGDVLGNKDDGAKVRYDADSNTLTLDNATIYGGGEECYGAGILADGDLNIIVYGENYVYGSDRYSSTGRLSGGAIEVWGYLYIGGSGKVTAISGKMETTAQNLNDGVATTYGICANDMTIAGATVVAEGKEAVGYQSYSNGILVAVEEDENGTSLYVTGGANVHAKGVSANSENGSDSLAAGIWTSYDFVISGASTVTAEGGISRGNACAESFGISVADVAVRENSNVSFKSGEAAAQNGVGRSVALSGIDYVEVNASNLRLNAGKSVGGKDPEIGYANSMGIWYAGQLNILNNAIVNVETGSAQSNEQEGVAYVYGIYGAGYSDDDTGGYMVVENSGVSVVNGDAEADYYAENYGLMLNNGYETVAGNRLSLCVENSRMNITAGKAKAIHGDANSDAIYSVATGVDGIIYGKSTVACVGGDAVSTNGIAASMGVNMKGALTVEESTLVATAGNATGYEEAYSEGVYALPSAKDTGLNDDSYALNFINAAVTATSQKAYATAATAISVFSLGVYSGMDDMNVSNTAMILNAGEASADNQAEDVAWSMGLYGGQQVFISGYSHITATADWGTINNVALQANEGMHFSETYEFSGTTAEFVQDGIQSIYQTDSAVPVIVKHPQAITYRYGDVDMNGVINAADALLVLEQAAGIRRLEGDALKLADTNNDGLVNAADALNILNIAAGII